jgi:F-type H+-transporting ATPase subunit delta
MIENLIGKRYAGALSDSVPDQGRLNPVLDSLNAFVGAFRAEAHLTRFFAHPAIPKEKKGALVKDLAARLKADPTVTGLLLLLVERNRILYLGKIAHYFQNVVDERQNQVRASITSATELSAANKERLASELGRVLGKTVLIETRVDESLIGGVLVRVGDRVADATLKNRLALLQRKIETEEGE